MSMTNQHPTETRAMPNALSPQRLAPQHIQELLLFEARLLNERHFEQWLTLLTGDVVFWVPARPDQPDGRQEASIVFDDRDLLESRIWRLRHPKMWSQLPPARAVRIVSNIMLDDGFEANGTVHSAFIMLEYRQNEQRVFGGTYEHVLRQEGDTLKIAHKTVRLVNSDAVLSNLALPF